MFPIPHQLQAHASKMEQALAPHKSLQFSFRHSGLQNHAAAPRKSLRCNSNFSLAPFAGTLLHLPRENDFPPCLTGSWPRGETGKARYLKIFNIAFKAGAKALLVGNVILSFIFTSGTHRPVGVVVAAEDCSLSLSLYHTAFLRLYKFTLRWDPKLIQAQFCFLL